MTVGKVVVLLLLCLSISATFAQTSIYKPSEKSTTMATLLQRSREFQMGGSAVQNGTFVGLDAAWASTGYNGYRLVASVMRFPDSSGDAMINVYDPMTSRGTRLGPSTGIPGSSGRRLLCTGATNTTAYWFMADRKLIVIPLDLVLANVRIYDLNPKFSYVGADGVSDCKMHYAGGSMFLVFKSDFSVDQGSILRWSAYGDVATSVQRITYNIGSQWGSVQTPFFEINGYAYGFLWSSTTIVLYHGMNNVLTYVRDMSGLSDGVSAMWLSRDNSRVYTMALNHRLFVIPFTVSSSGISTSITTLSIHDYGFTTKGLTSSMVPFAGFPRPPWFGSAWADDRMYLLMWQPTAAKMHIARMQISTVSVEDVLAVELYNPFLVALPHSTEFYPQSLFLSQTAPRVTNGSQSVVHLGCVPGYVTTSDGIYCTMCTAGYYSPSALDQTCSSCGQGQLSFNASTGCTDCFVGTYSAVEAAASCTACPAGYYQGSTGATFCNKCDEESYNPNVRASQCSKCPANCKTYLSSSSVSGATAVTQCGPKPGYYRINSGNEAPEVVPCVPEDACPGGLSNDCAPGYSAYRCGSCADDYYRGTDGTCTKCAGTPVALLIGVAVVFLIFVFAFTRIAGGASRFQSLSISFSFLQVTAYMGGFAVGWPTQVKTLLGALSIFNFNLGLAQPECQSSLLRDSFNRWLLSMLFAPAVLAVLLLIYIVSVIGISLKNFMQKRSRDSDHAVRIFLGKSHVAASQTEKELLKNDEMFLKEAAYRRSSRSACDRMIGAFVIFMVLGYLFLSQAALQVFDCTSGGNNDYMYDADPSISCWKSDSPQSRMALISGLVFVPLYVIGFPLALLMYIFRKRARLSEPEVAMKVGFIVNAYQRRYAFYEMVVMMRKLALVCLQLFFTNSTLFSAAGALVVIFASIVTHISIAPFRDHTLYKQELFLMINNFIVLLCGVLFLSPFPSETSRDGTGWFVVLWIVLGLLICALRLAWEFWGLLYNVLLIVIRKRTHQEQLGLRRTLAEYALSTCRSEYVRTTVQYIWRARRQDLEQMHATFLALRLDSVAFQTLFEGIDDAVFTKRMQDREKSREKKSSNEQRRQQQLAKPSAGDWQSQGTEMHGWSNEAASKYDAEVPSLRRRRRMREVLEYARSDPMLEKLAAELAAADAAVAATDVDSPVPRANNAFDSGNNSKSAATSHNSHTDSVSSTAPLVDVESPPSPAASRVDVVVRMKGELDSARSTRPVTPAWGDAVSEDLVSILDLMTHLRKTSLFHPDFRSAAVEWLVDARDANVRSLQYTMELFHDNVVRPRIETAQMTGKKSSEDSSSSQGKKM